MKKYMFALMAIIFTLVFSPVAYALEDLTLTHKETEEITEVLEISENLIEEEGYVHGFEITGGLSGKDSEATFDTYRTITGIAKKGTVVTISVFQSQEDKEPAEYIIKVSSLGVFTQDIELNEGENIIVITAEKSFQSCKIKTTINRKSLDIKKELESNNRALPYKAK